MQLLNLWRGGWLSIMTMPMVGLWLRRLSNMSHAASPR
jgi:hypothetical protein